LEIATREEPVTRFPEELEQAFQAHHGLVFRAAYRITGNESDAEDVLQTVFLRLLGRDRSAPPLENAQGYLHRAAVNAALDVVRARRNEPVDPAQTLQGGSSAGDHELRDLLRQSLALLPPHTAEVFALRFLEGYTNGEIARMLGTSQVRIAVTIHRARRQLQREICTSLGVRP
jgi:RNA polymerase sigma-70 factor (ECF subfamily)